MNRSKKIAMFGGTFNPIHRGHVFLAEEFQRALELDEVLLIPTNVPPHKQASDLASGEDRLEMCRLAVAGHPHLRVSDIEMRREGKSYTVDTLHQLQEIYPDAQLHLIMGADMFLSLHHWVQFEEILRIAVICAATRDQADHEALTQCGEELKKYGARYFLLPVQPPTVSSTEIRQAIAQGASTDALLLPCVREYIDQKQLYRL